MQRWHHLLARGRGDESQIKTGEKLETPHVVSYEDEFAERLKKTDAKLGAAEYEFAGEKFFRPTSLAELFSLQKNFSDAESLSPARRNLGWRSPNVTKSFPRSSPTEAVVELTEIKSTATEWHIGGAVTLTVIKDKLGAGS